MARFTAHLRPTTQHFNAQIRSGSARFSASFGDASRNPYTGDYTVTPSGETQILETRGRLALDNITIYPIPSNYGKISWDGAFLTVE